MNPAPRCLRVATVNVNGIRAADRRGFRAWLSMRGCDVVALQEVRCPESLLPEGIFDGWQVAYDAGNRPGRNGVAILSRTPIVGVRTGLGSREFDVEGRYLEVDLDLPEPLTIASLYLPKGAAPDQEPLRYERKMRFLHAFSRHLTHTRRAARAAGREYLVMGDFNIAHTKQDLRNWRSNQHSSGFLPEEREWIAAQLNPRTLVDVVRTLHPEADGPYSWWTWRGKAFDTDTGWRIDYQLASPGLARRAVVGGTDRASSYDARMSDHAPVVVDYALRTEPSPAH